LKQNEQSFLSLFQSITQGPGVIPNEAVWVPPTHHTGLPDAVYSGNSKASQLFATFSGYIRPDTGLTTFMTRTGLVTNTHAMNVAWDLDSTAQSGQRNQKNDGKNGTDATFALGGGVHQGRKIYFCFDETPAPTLDYNISQFNGTSAWNMASFPTVNPSKEFDASPTVETAVGVALSDDGTRFFIVDADTTRVTQWDAGTAYDVDTLVYNSVFFDYSNEDVTNQGISFNVDGTSFYMVSDSSVIYQYNLVTPWDLSTASYSGDSFNASGTIATARNVYVKPDETSIYVMGTSVNSLYQFNM
jgi:hypothetical protein